MTETTDSAVTAAELDWLRIAKAAGEHGIRYRTNSCLEAFLRDIAAPASPSPGLLETNWLKDAQWVREAVIEECAKELDAAADAYALHENPELGKIVWALAEDIRALAQEGGK